MKFYLLISMYSIICGIKQVSRSKGCGLVQDLNWFWCHSWGRYTYVPVDVYWHSIGWQCHTVRSQLGLQVKERKFRDLYGLVGLIIGQLGWFLEEYNMLLKLISLVLFIISKSWVCATLIGINVHYKPSWLNVFQEEFEPWCKLNLYSCSN